MKWSASFVLKKITGDFLPVLKASTLLCVYVIIAPKIDVHDMKSLKMFIMRGKA